MQCTIDCWPIIVGYSPISGDSSDSSRLWSTLVHLVLAEKIAQESRDSRDDLTKPI